MDDSDQSWVDVVALHDLPHDAPTALSADSTPLILIRRDDDVIALGGKCPHKGAPLELGTLCQNADGDRVIVCPWHKAVFCVESGKLLEPLALDPLPHYPVEIKDGHVMVSLQPITAPEPPSVRENEIVAIVGAGAAGVTAATALRQQGFAGRIVMFSPETELPYDRTALSKTFLSSAPDAAKLPPIRPADFYETHNIERICDVVEHVSIHSSTLRLRDGGPFRADHILLANGSKPKTLTVPGAELAGVHVLRSAKDARAITREVGSDSTAATRTAVVIGASFIALEAAAALRKRGVGVAVISHGDVPFEKTFGREIGLRMRDLHEKKGVAFIADCSVTELIGGEKVEHVKLDDGTVLNADLVIVGIGVEPVVGYIEDQYLADDGGIKVDAQMCVAANIYAAGDIASFPHAAGWMRIEHWRTAQCQARIAVQAILGLPVETLPVPWFWTQQYDQKLEYVGWPGRFDVVDIEGDLDNFDFLARLKRGGRTVGIIASKHAKAIGKAAIDFDAA